MNFFGSLRLLVVEGGGGSLTKRIAVITLLVLVALAAIALKSWWRTDHATRVRAELKGEIEAVDHAQESLRGALDSLRTRTRAELDSLSTWLAAQADTAARKKESLQDRAEKAWKEAVAGLPRDLSAYERRIALSELRETLANWFDLTEAQLRNITGGS